MPLSFNSMKILLPNKNWPVFLVGILCWLFLLFASNCGGSKPPIAESTVPLGFIPFPTERLSGYTSELNRRLEITLGSSGSFQVIELQSTPSYLSKTQIEERFPALFSGTDSVKANVSMEYGAPLMNESNPGEVNDTIPNSVNTDSLSASTAASTQGSISSPRWILTGRLLHEIEYVHKGTRIPFILYSPSVKLRAELEMRLYDRLERRWKDIRRIQAEVSRKSGWQVLEFDPSHPSLAISAPERQRLRSILYDELFGKLNTVLESLLEVQR